MDDPRYCVKVLRRLKWKGKLARPGDYLHLPELASAVHACAMGNARPADERTRLDVELALAVRQTLPRG